MAKDAQNSEFSHHSANRRIQIYSVLITASVSLLVGVIGSAVTFYGVIHQKSDGSQTILQSIADDLKRWAGQTTSTAVNASASGPVDRLQPVSSSSAGISIVPANAEVKFGTFNKCNGDPDWLEAASIAATYQGNSYGVTLQMLATSGPVAIAHFPRWQPKLAADNGDGSMGYVEVNIPEVQGDISITSAEKVYQSAPKISGSSSTIIASFYIGAAVNKNTPKYVDVSLPISVARKRGVGYESDQVLISCLHIPVTNTK